MDFIDYTNHWVKSEVIQGKIMITFGVLLLLVFIGIIKSQNELLRGMLIPIGLMFIILIGYGGFILQSRPNHAKNSISLYQQSKKDAIDNEKSKHINDNKAGKTLMKVYPILIILCIVALLCISNPYYKGMTIGFALLFISAYIIDYGFVSRSDAFLSFLAQQNSN